MGYSVADPRPDNEHQLFLLEDSGVLPVTLKMFNLA